MRLWNALTPSARFARWFQWCLAVLAAVGMAYLWAQERGAPLPYIPLSNLHEIILLAVELSLALYLWRNFQSGSWGGEQRVTYLFIFLAANCFIVYPFLPFYLDEARQDVPAIQAIQPYLVPAFLVLLALTVLLALLSRHDLRRFRAWLAEVNRAQKEHDQEVAREQDAYFSSRYAQLRGVPVAGAVIARLYREGWLYLIGLLALLIAGALLRLWNLGALAPYADELFHLNAAKDILEGEAIQQVEYRRSLALVTLPVALSFKIFGDHVWAGRLPGVVINLLAVFPLYYLGKRLNKPVALLAVGLFVFSPWMIAASRIVREYAYYPAYFYLVAWVMLKFYDRLPSGISINHNLRKLLTPSLGIPLLVLALVVAYGAVLDRRSTFKVILGLYPALAILVLRKVNWRDRRNMIITALALLGGALLVFTILNEETRDLFTGSFNSYFLTLFSDESQLQWYFERPLFFILVLLLVLLVVEYWNKDRVVLPFTLLAFLIFHLAFAVFWVKGEKPRYAIATEFWYVLLMAAGLFATYVSGARLFKVKHIVWIGMLVLFWNIPHTLVPSLHTANGYAPVTGEHHADFMSAWTYLQSNAGPDDVVISTSYFRNYMHWQGDPNVAAMVVFPYLAPDAQEVVFNAIEKYPSGWILLYSRMDDEKWQPLPPKDLIHAGVKVEYVGWFGSSYVYHWGP